MIVIQFMEQAKVQTWRVKEDGAYIVFCRGHDSVVCSDLLVVEHSVVSKGFRVGQGWRTRVV